VVHRRYGHWGGVSGSALVFVDDAAENIATDDLAVDGGRSCRAAERLIELETAVGVMPEYSITPSSRNFLVTIHCGYLPGDAR